MDPYINEWLNLVIRFAHVITGIAWIGASFYFVWLDNHLETPPQEKADKEAVDKKYNDLIASADKKFGAKDLQSAILDFKEAQKVKPEEDYQPELDLGEED